MRMSIRIPSEMVHVFAKPDIFEPCGSWQVGCSSPVNQLNIDMDHRPFQDLYSTKIRTEDFTLEMKKNATELSILAGLPSFLA